MKGEYAILLVDVKQEGCDDLNMVLLISVLIFLAVAAVLIAADILLAREFYKAAVMKGWPSRRYFWFPVLLTQAGYLLVIALPDRGGAGMTALVSDDLPEL